MLDEFEAAAGRAAGFFHLNDSEGALGSNKDRHMLIGDGRIGAEAFRLAARRPAHARRAADPGDAADDHEIAEDDDTPDPYDVRMIELLGELSAG